MAKESTPRRALILTSLQKHADNQTPLPPLKPIERPITKVKIISPEELAERTADINNKILSGFDELYQLSEIVDVVSSDKGDINLGLREEEVNWKAMPQAMRDLFQPVFDKDYLPIILFSLSLARKKNQVSMNVELQQSNSLYLVINTVYTRSDVTPTSETNPVYKGGVSVQADYHHSASPGVPRIEVATNNINIVPSSSYGASSDMLELDRQEKAVEIMDGIFIFTLKEMDRRYSQS